MWTKTKVRGTKCQNIWVSETIFLVFSTIGALVVITVKGYPVHSIPSPVTHFAHCSSARSNSVLTFPKIVSRQIVWNACTWFPEIGTTLMTLPSLFPSLPAPVLSSATQIICRAVSKRSDHITSTWVAFFPSFPQHSYVIHQGWTRKLFFSRSGAGRGGARPTSMGQAGNTNLPRGGEGVKICRKMALIVMEYSTVKWQ